LRKFDLTERGAGGAAVLFTRKVASVALVSTSLIGAVQPDPDIRTLTVALSGEAVSNFAHPSGGTGDLDASGLVRLTIKPGERQVCYDFNLSGLSTPMMAHIQKAPTLSNGPPIVSLFTGTGSELDGCAPANTGQLWDMISNPSSYYVSVATTEYPDGALRGQLSTT
jgi:hypothetical protein